MMMLNFYAVTDTGPPKEKMEEKKTEKKAWKKEEGGEDRLDSPMSVDIQTSDKINNGPIIHKGQQGQFVTGACSISVTFSS